MPDRHVLKPASLGLLLGLAVVAAACDIAVDSGSAIYTAREERRFAVTGKPDLTLGTFDGSIAIRAWDRAEVLVEVEKRAGDKTLADEIVIKIEHSANRIRVDVPRPTSTESRTGLHIGGGSAFFGRFGSSARLTVTVPRECDIVARTGDGTIAVQHVAGRLDLETGDGGVKGRDLEGAIKVHTEDGALEFRDLRGSVDLNTGDGGIEVSGVLSAVRAETGDGAVTIRAEPGSAVAAPWEIRTGDGSVTIDAPETLGAEVDARTSDGRVRIEGLPVSGAADHERSSLRGRLGTGGQPLRVRTGSGTITIRRF